MNIVLAGDCGVDRYIPLGLDRPGGITLNAAAHVRRLFSEGDRVTVLTALGTDPESRIVRAALENLAKLEHNFAIYDKWGFHDSVNVDSGFVSPYYLSLDQGMIMAAIGNALEDDMLRRAFVTPEFQNALQPVISIEQFNASPRERVPDIERTQ